MKDYDFLFNNEELDKNIETLINSMNNKEQITSFTYLTAYSKDEKESDSSPDISQLGNTVINQLFS